MKKFYIANLPIDTDRPGIVLTEYYQSTDADEVVSFPEDGWTDLDEALAAFNKLATNCFAFSYNFYLVATEDPNFVGKERNEDGELSLSDNFKIVAKIHVDKPGHGYHEI